MGAAIFAMFAASVSAGSYVVAVRRKLVPLARGRLLDRLPPSFGAWRQEPGRDDMVDPVVVDDAFTTAARMYDLEVQKEYVRPSGQRIMLDGVFMRQVSQEEKFHWPEFCYATQGFTIRRLSKVFVDMPGGRVRASRFVAVRDDRREVVLYLTRVGDIVPAGGSEVRVAIFQSSLSLTLPDAVLLRVSTLIDGDEADQVRSGTDLLRDFLQSLVQNSDEATRMMLVGEYA